MDENWIQRCVAHLETLDVLYQDQQTLVRLSKIPESQRGSGQKAWITRCAWLESARWDKAHARNAVMAVRKLSELERKAIAQCENLKYPAVLLDLAKDESDVVRWNLARNPSISLHVVEILAVDVCRDVRSCLVLNVATPDKVVANLARRDLGGSFRLLRPNL